MNCGDCQDLIQMHLDGLELTEQTVLELHLASCPTCRVLHLAAGRLQQGLRLLAAPAPPRGLAGQIAARLLAEYKARNRRRHRIGYAAAAAVLLGLVLSARFLWFPAGSDRSLITAEMIVKVEQIKPPINPVVHGPTVRDSMSEVGSMMVSAATRTADATVVESRLLLQLVPSPSLPTLPAASTLEAPTLPLREAGQEVSEVLAPVADSAKRAVGLFLRDLPPMNLDEKPGL
jgi:anti-sigma factor RsiW